MSVLRRWKIRLGYYEKRRRLLEKPFERSLRPSDSFLVGHPKSGNTWLAYMLAILLVKDRNETVTLKNVGQFVPFVHGRDDRIRRHARLPDPRVFRNENPQYPDLYPKTIYLVRDPRAALVSFWHMYQVIFGERSLPFGQFLDHYMSMNRIFDTWNSKLRRWDRQVEDYITQARSDPKILVLRYEDMVGDRRTSLEEVARFLNLASSQEDIDLAVERGSFKAMRKVEDRFGAEAYEGKAKGEGKFVRVGRTESWREEMAAGEATRIEAEFASAMRLAGYL